MKFCVMCEREAFFIAPQTDEYLCLKCNYNNDSLAFKNGDIRKGKPIGEVK